MKRHALILAGFFALYGCGGGSSPGAPIPGAPVTAAAPGAATDARDALSLAEPGPVTEHVIDPALTDPGITMFRSGTLTYAPTSPNNGSLLVFLPGQQANPGAYTTINEFAASIGYHVVVIDYPNQNTPQQFCNLDPACDGNVLWEKWDGRPGPAGVSFENSIKNRVKKLLLYLAATYPAEGWGTFMSSGEVTWWNVTLAGHSLGSWEAGAIGKIVQVKRVVMFAGPDDLENGKVADWVGGYGVTPNYKQYIFTHVADVGYTSGGIPASAAALNLPSLGGWTSVDGASPPYGESHLLTTVVPSSDPHHSVAFDGNIPLGPGGVPIYTAAWRYLLYPE